MQTIDERCYGHEPAQSTLVGLRLANDMQSKRIDWTVQDNVKKAIEIDRLNQLRLQDTKRHEDAMRVLVNMLRTRGDISRNAEERAKNWQTIAVALGRKNRILESRIRSDDRTFKILHRL